MRKRAMCFRLDSGPSPAEGLDAYARRLRLRPAGGFAAVAAPRNDSMMKPRHGRAPHSAHPRPRLRGGRLQRGSDGGSHKAGHSGARAKASEPGIQKQTRCLCLDSGSGPSDRPGMTKCQASRNDNMMKARPHHKPVIPGRAESANPESRSTDCACVWIPGPALRTVPE
jgi:hypothetical protein